MIRRLLAPELAEAVMAACREQADLLSIPNAVRVITHKPTPLEVELHRIRTGQAFFGASPGIHPPRSQSFKMQRVVRKNKLETMDEGIYFYRVVQSEEYPKFHSRHYALSVHGMEDPNAHIVTLIKTPGDQPFELEDGGQRLAVVTFEDMSFEDTGEYQCSVELPH